MSDGAAGIVIGLLAACLAGACAAQEHAAQQRTNFFDDPFVQVTRGIGACPVPEGPAITRTEMLAQSHDRAERGASCYREGSCRLPNSYMYDREIVARIATAVAADERFARTSVWVEGRRRWVWLKGCVRSVEQSAALEQLARSTEEVDAVFNELVVDETR